MYYVIGDIHCQIDALKRLLGKLNLQEDDKVVFVGDWLDRAFAPGDIIDTMKWVVDNISQDGQFISVIGNHDYDIIQEIEECISIHCGDEMAGVMGYVDNRFLCIYTRHKMSNDEIYELFYNFYKKLKDMSMYFNFNTKDFNTGEYKDFYVTHSWIVDKNNNGIWDEEFNWDAFDSMSSMWDRSYSVDSVLKFKESDATIVHGHTPNLGRCNPKVKGIKPLTRIIHVNEKNINVDCCAFRSPMLGGNLAAYRCEDGAEFYAYDDNDFYKLLKMHLDSLELKGLEFDTSEYIMVIAGYKWWGDIYSKDATDDFEFDCDMTREAYLEIKERIAVKDVTIHELNIAKNVYVKKLTDSWRKLREPFNNDIHSYNKGFTSFFDTLF